MVLQVIGTAVLQCMWGAAPVPYVTLPIHMEVTFIMPAATITDTVPMLNIMPFAMCSSKANPMVIAIMASSLGAVQVAPCVPMTVAPWAPPIANVIIGGAPTIDNAAMAMCMWAGKISVMVPGQATTIVT